MYFRTLEVKTKDNETVAIRSIRPDEAEKVLSCLEKYISQTRFLVRMPGDPFCTVEEERKYLETMLDKSTDVQLGAYLNNELVGLGSINISSDIFSRVKHRCRLGISLDEKVWNKGIGTRLMDALIDVAQRVGYEQIELEVLEDNERAIRLYKKYGFEIYGTKPNTFKDNDGTYHDEHFMVKKLTVKFEPEIKATTDLEEWIEEQGIQLRY